MLSRCSLITSSDRLGLGNRAKVDIVVVDRRHFRRGAFPPPDSPEAVLVEELLPPPLPQDAREARVAAAKMQAKILFFIIHFLSVPNVRMGEPL